MKKFFRALALVLALTLIVGAVPAMAADSYSVKVKKKTLYVATSAEIAKDKNAVTALGNNPEKGTKSKLKARVTYAKILGISKKDAQKLDITTEVKSVPTDAVVANDDTKAIRAYGIGEATISFKVKGQSVGSVVINAKKSATEVFFGQDFKGVKDEFTAQVNAEYKVSIPRSKEGVKVDTDERRIIVKDAEGKDITADVAKPVDGKDRLWTLKFAKAGTYTVIGESFQSVKNYPGATQTSSITVTVKEGTLDNAKQTTYKAFELEFSNEAIAKIAVDNTTPSLNSGSAAVTEDKDIIKVWQVGSNGEEIAAFIGKLDIDPVKKNIVTITMFADLTQGATYKVQYGEFTKTFVAVKWQPEKLDNSYAYRANKEAEGGTATLKAFIFAIGDQGQDVDITDKVIDLGNVEYADTAKSNDYTSYNVSGNLVDFYKNNYTAKVKCTFTFYGNGAAETYTNEFDVTSSDNRVFSVVYYYLRGDLSYDASNKREAVISADEGNKRLAVKVKIDTVVNGKVVDTEYVDGTDTLLKFVTSNTDKLAIEETGGLAYAPKKANATVAVWLYYGDKVVDADAATEGVQAIPVTVYDHKKLGSASVTMITDGKLFYSAFADKAVNGYDAYSLGTDSEIFRITVKDEQEVGYEDVEITVEKVTDALDAAQKVYFAGDPAYKLIKGGYVNNTFAALTSGTGTTGVRDLVFTADTLDNESVKTLTYKITISDKNSSKKIPLTVTFKAKNTSNANVTKKEVEKVDGYTYRIIGSDSEGFRVCGYYLANTSGALNAESFANSTKLYLGFFKNSDGKETYSTTNGKTATLVTITNKIGGGLTKIGTTADIVETNGAVTPSAITVTGSAISTVREVARHNASANTYIESTSYSARAYSYSGSRYSVVNSKNFDYAPTLWYTLSWKWNQAYVETTNVKSAIDEAITFTYNIVQDGWNNVKIEGSLSELIAAGVPISATYTEKENDSVSVLYVYVDATEAANLAVAAGKTTATSGSAAPIYVETKILRTIYMGVEK